MIGLVLAAMAAGIIGVRIGSVLEEKRFRAAIDRLFVELESCRRLSLAAQVDWIAVLEEKNGAFVLRKACPELGKEVLATWKSNCEMSVNGKRAHALSFLFTSSGKVSPAGELTFKDKKRSVSWRLPEQFSIFESKSSNT